MSLQDPFDVLAAVEAQLDEDADDAPEHCYMGDQVFHGPLPKLNGGGGSGGVHHGPLPKPAPNRIADRNDFLKKAGNATSTVGSYGVGIAQIASGSPGVVALATGATVAGAGPIGLLVASLVFSVGFSVQAGVSAHKTHRHIKELEDILAGANGYACGKRHGLDHHHVLGTALPYIIAKKRAKRARRAFSTVPFAVSLETARSAAKAGWKKFVTRSKGRARNYHAHMLARHHCGSDCELTAAIIKSLFWVDAATVEDLRSCDAGEVAAVLSTKMKSV